jgi:steroid delta-isomerase-like uncharacterized protein
MTVQMIEAYYRAFNARDYNGMLELLADEVIHDVNQGQREVGRDVFAAFLRRMDHAYSEQITELAVLSDARGERFAAEFTVRGKYLAADPGMPPARGQTYQLPAGTFFEVQDERITRVTTYYNLRDWLDQVGA